MSLMVMCDQCGDTQHLKSTDLADWISVGMGAGSDRGPLKEYCTLACAQAGLAGVHLEHTLLLMEAADEAEDER